MAQTHYALSWPSYQSNVCASFSSFQQNGEMVDMTLAADGHIVKVHQILMALSSPYLKELICSAPCQHPVIFLNNVSNQILTSLLEYIYSGEVLVPMKDFPAFVATAKQLKIKGLENVTQFVSPTKTAKPKAVTPKVQQRTVTVTRSNDEDNQVYHVMSTSNIGTDNEMASNKMISDEQHDYDTSMVEDQDYEIEEEAREISYEDVGQTVDIASLNPNTLQYTVSNRGSLQAIVNRYIYNHTSDSKKTGEKKWRCNDYRTKKCNALITTKGDVVSKRVNPHNHGFHDKKILDKIARKMVYSTIEQLHCEKGTSEQNDDDDWKI